MNSNNKGCLRNSQSKQPVIGFPQSIAGCRADFPNIFFPIHPHRHSTCHLNSDIIAGDYRGKVNARIYTQNEIEFLKFHFHWRGLIPHSPVYLCSLNMYTHAWQTHCPPRSTAHSCPACSDCRTPPAARTPTLAAAFPRWSAHSSAGSALT